MDFNEISVFGLKYRNYNKMSQDPYFFADCSFYVFILKK